MKEIMTHIGQREQTVVKEVGVHCTREGEVRDNLGQRVWLSDQVTVEKLNGGIRSDLDDLGSSNIIEVRIIDAGVVWV